MGNATHTAGKQSSTVTREASKLVTANKYSKLDDFIDTF